MQSVRVLVADDDAFMRASLAELINSHPELELVGAAHDAEEAIEIAAGSRPDVAMLDYRMPGGGVYAAREIRRLSPGTAVLGLSAYGDPGTEGQMLGAGAREFLVKGECTIDELVASILAAAGEGSMDDRSTPA
jgi:DNA-binding NarL/FixJ family response regulator